MTVVMNVGTPIFQSILHWKGPSLRLVSFLYVKYSASPCSLWALGRAPHFMHTLQTAFCERLSHSDIALLLKR